ncbi:MAG TPA: glycosyltransferase [Patescibacteria group bacterium]|nr:glycosyltransferase [Patescibacteria group bacterium]
MTQSVKIVVSKTLAVNNLSIIIPVLNEEKYIGNLLQILVNQSLKNFEVIVVDGKSTDNTIKVVEKFKNKLNLKIIKAPHKGVSFQRNLGASNASAEILLFLDADVSFENNFLEKIVKEFNTKDYGVGTVASFPDDHNFLDTFLSTIYNFYQRLTANFNPVVYGFIILSTKIAHKSINGFNENLIFAEDTDYVKRIVEKGFKFQIIDSIKIYYSTRRIKREGRLVYEYKMIKYFFTKKIKYD